jgi:integrase
MLYKRGEVWHVKFKAGGKVFAKSARTTSKRKAQEFERDLRTAVARELHAGRTGQPVDRTYGEALEKWIQTGSPKSMYSHAMNTALYLKDVQLHLVVPAAHEMKASMLRRELSPQTINRRLAVVRRVLNMAYKEWDWIREPLGQKIQLISEKGMAREFYLSQEEVVQLLAAVTDPEALKVIHLAAYTGLRRGELLTLKPDQWQKPYIVLSNKTKSGKPRTVPVIEDLHDLVTLPFKITEHNLRKAFEAARDAIERPDIRFHDLRHTYASWLAKNPDIPLTTIRDILGHSNLSVTSKYAHLRGDTFDMVSRALKK